ncbi:hypothetical protein CLOSYM_04074 [[Clostridium] symbiosum ATCC 14940]|uniref:Uncharacterized protein n=1 Tax=[Clostridium] symbiosum ATCC 14940 TaxID=411472 RepID=A0ABC9TSQ4_CLOSY|nr:hypothetical protein CLOSYM_04074 [[Clostridium] symbiosum ATCC 14940]
MYLGISLLFRQTEQIFPVKRYNLRLGNFEDCKRLRSMDQKRPVVFFHQNGAFVLDGFFQGNEVFLSR